MSVDRQLDTRGVSEVSQIATITSEAAAAVDAAKRERSSRVETAGARVSSASSSTPKGSPKRTALSEVLFQGRENCFLLVHGSTG